MNSNEFTSLLMEIEQFIDGEKLPNGYPGIRTNAVFVELTYKKRLVSQPFEQFNQYPEPIVLVDDY